MSYTLIILEKYVFFKDLQMILLPFFDILTGFRFRKNTLKSDVHSLRRPCIRAVIPIQWMPSVIGVVSILIALHAQQTYIP